MVTDANGCTATAVETLTDPPALQLLLKKTDPACAGASTGALDLTVSGGTGNGSYAWSNSASSEDLTQVPSGTYSVLVTDANGCTATAVETLSNPPILVLNLPKLNLNCPGDQDLMDLTAAGGTPGLSFLWSNGETTEDIKVSNSGLYEVTVTDSKGCKMSASATVSTLGASPVLSLTTDTLTCQKTSGLISVTSNLANTSFVWSGPSAYSSTLSSPVISFGGIFSVKATEPLGGCSSVGEVFVPLDTLAPTASIGVHFLEIPCNEPSISIPALGSSSGPGFSILWTAIAGGSLLSGEQSLSPTVGSSGLYRLSIANLFNGCVSADTVEVVRLAAPEGVAIADSVRCFGEKNGVIQVVSTTGGVPPLSYSIDHQSFKNDPVFENLAAGDYQVFIRDAKGCEFTTEIKVAQPEPIAVDLTGDSTVFQGATVHLKAMVSPAQLVPAHIDWLAAGVNLPNHQLIQSVQLFQSTIFQIAVTDKNGCSASDSWLVKVKKQHRIYAPNIIFPENPGGTNQTFLIFAGEEVSEMESLEIFDRWGNQVFFNHHFQPNEEKEGWSGTFRGKLVDAGVFIWVAKVRLQDGTLEVIDGDLTVIR